MQMRLCARCGRELGVVARVSGSGVAIRIGLRLQSIAIEIEIEIATEIEIERMERGRKASRSRLGCRRGRDAPPCRERARR